MPPARSVPFVPTRLTPSLRFTLIVGREDTVPAALFWPGPHSLEKQSETSGIESWLRHFSVPDFGAATASLGLSFPMEVWTSYHPFCWTLRGLVTVESRVGVCEMEAGALPMTSAPPLPAGHPPAGGWTPCPGPGLPALSATRAIYCGLVAPPSCGDSSVPGSLCPLIFSVKQFLHRAGPSPARGTQGWFGFRQLAWEALILQGLLGRTSPDHSAVSCSVSFSPHLGMVMS